MLVQFMRPTGFFFRALAFLGLLALATASAQAAVNLSTGLDAFDTLITLGNTPDGHWTVDQPSDGIAPAKVVAPGDADWPGLARQWAVLGLDHHRPDRSPKRARHSLYLLPHVQSHCFRRCDRHNLGVLGDRRYWRPEIERNDDQQQCRRLRRFYAVLRPRRGQSVRCRPEHAYHHHDFFGQLLGGGSLGGQSHERARAIDPHRLVAARRTWHRGGAVASPSGLTLRPQPTPRKPRPHAGQSLLAQTDARALGCRYNWRPCRLKGCGHELRPHGLDGANEHTFASLGSRAILHNGRFSPCCRQPHFWLRTSAIAILCPAEAVFKAKVWSLVETARATQPQRGRPARTSPKRARRPRCVGSGCLARK